MKAAIRFETIDLERHAGVCTAYRRDSFFTSFGATARFEDEAGEDGSIYLSNLRRRMSAVPEGNTHVWLNDRIIGQTEMSVTAAPGVGYVNLFYLEEPWRGQGLGRRLHEHVCMVFKARGKTAVQLSVSRTNERALKVYAALGWRSLGPRLGREKMLLMQCSL